MLALPILLIGTVVLNTAPMSMLDHPGGTWFIWSGIIGMGVCDIMMLSAYTRLGARVTSLTVNACAAPLAALFGWLALSEHPTWAQSFVMLVIIGSVALVLKPRGQVRFDALGLWCALGSALTFAGASVMSRIGFIAAAEAHHPIHWLDSTVIRVATGIALSVGVFLVAGLFSRAWRDGPGRWRQASSWLLLNAMLGPVMGLCCYQWALSTTSAAEVHAVVAILPVLVLAFTWVVGRERPDRTALIGTITAVMAVIALALLRA